MFGIGMGELVVILVIALLLFGANRLPEIARSLGRAVNEFNKIASGIGGDPDPKKTPDEKKEPKLPYAG